MTASTAYPSRRATMRHLYVLSLVVWLAGCSGPAQVPFEEPPRLVGGIEGLQRRVVYPDFERRAGVEGTVTVTFVVGIDGRPSDIAISRSVSPGLDRAAVEAVSRAVFTPAKRQGQPVAVDFTLPVSFRITMIAR